MEPTVSLTNATIAIFNNIILTDVNLKIDKGEFVYLIGKTGSGKSTLLKNLYGELPLKAGNGEVVGFDLMKLKRKKIPFLRRKLGIVFQDFQLLSDRNINDNLVFVMKATGWKDKKEINQRIETVLERVGLKAKGYKFPHELSGGEQQRVAIARALINDPDLILADEPTGNLDPETSNKIMELLLEISKNGRAILFATHDYSMIEKYPARIIKCHEGKLIEAQLTENNL